MTTREKKKMNIILARLFFLMCKSGCLSFLYRAKDYCSIDTEQCLPTYIWKHHVYQDGIWLGENVGQSGHLVKTVPHVKANSKVSTATKTC